MEGYRMEKTKSQDENTEVTSSREEWLAGFVILLIMFFMVYGMKRTTNKK